ncbi:Hpt domain-containing protein [Rhodoferax bucti]|uniref:Hpt domain-containing protein n=1 Tax=Rhodoferax bucti TaxID=2576305 RepID=UPI001108B79B|nr:Hpt domain-containing protein [Rhodoferax bucti]
MSAAAPQGDSPQYLNIAGALEQIGDEGALREMLPMVLDSLQRDVPAIANLLAQGDVTGANHLLHPLKGFIPIFCTPDLYARVSEVEQMSKKGDAPTVGAAYALLAPELRVFEAEVARYLGAPA